METDPMNARSSARATPDIPGSAPDAGREAHTSVQLSRLRWRCRRGMLENDLILARFLDARGERITEPELVALGRLLELSDGELWDLLSGRSEHDDATLRPLVAELRAA
jgi:antitoxin CptB